MSKHTPGPWEYENVHDCPERNAYAVVKDANGKILFDTLNSDVAEIHTEHDEGSVYRWDETGRRNLTLAAASPELLAACKNALELIDNRGNLRFMESAALLKNAIAKAEGGK